jgi:hypothetical protein
MTLGAYLNQPFPYPGSKWKLNIFLLSLFVSLFLLIFQPLAGYSIPFKNLILIGYGLISLITGAILHLIFLNLFPKIFDEDTWTIKKHLLWFAFQLFFIGIANHYYSLHFIPFHPRGIEGILLFEFRAFSLGIFPITMHVMLTYNYLLSKNLKEASQINQVIVNTPNSKEVEKKVCLVADNEKDFLEFNIHELNIIESVGNYIQVYYCENGTFKSSLLRCSLKRAETELSAYSEILKCHRAFIVNLNNITYVKGSSQGYRLWFGQHDKEIPVSRNYAKLVKEELESLHNE